MKDIEEITAEPPVWQDRQGRTPVPMEKWGKGHWSLLGYIESVTVEHHGLIDWRRLTLSKRNWPMLFAARDEGRALGHYTTSFDRDAADKYGLRLRNDADGQPVLLAGHCEADALMDMVTEDVVTIEMPKPDKGGDWFLKPSGKPIEDGPHPRFVTGRAEWDLMPWAKFQLTARGRAIANLLREYKATDGATWSGFADYREGKSACG